MKKNLIIAALISGLLTVGCGDSGSTEKVTDDSTDVVYEGVNIPLNASTMYYSLDLGPFDVSAYEQIRIITNLSTTSNIVNVAIIEVDDQGNILEALDQFNLEPGVTDRVTSVYDLPGRKIQISYSSVTSSQPHVTCLIYGR